MTAGTHLVAFENACGKRPPSAIISDVPPPKNEIVDTISLTADLLRPIRGGGAESGGKGALRLD